MALTSKMKDKISKLPKYAQKYIKELEEKITYKDHKIKKLEEFFPWTEPDMHWFTIFHPRIRMSEDRGKHINLFILLENHAQCVASIGPNDFVFVGRGKNIEK